jgi:hypothetical protein
MTLFVHKTGRVLRLIVPAMAICQEGPAKFKVIPDIY